MYEKVIEDTLKRSFQLFRQQYIAFILGTIIAIIGMILIITIPPLIFGLYYMAMQLINGKKLQVTDVFKGFDYFFLSWGLILLALIGITIGLAFLIIPGLILMVLLQYAIPIALLEKKGPWDSLVESYRIGKKYFTFSVALFVVLAVISGFGAVTKVGALLTTPFTVLCLVVATRAIIRLPVKQVKKAAQEPQPKR